MRHRGYRGRAGTRGLVLPFVLVTSLLLPMSVSAQDRSSDDIARELEAAERKTAELDVELGVVRDAITDAEIELAQIGARLDDARGRLRAAEGQVALAEAALTDAQEEHATALEAHEGAEDLLALAVDELAAEEKLLTDQLVQTFKYGTVGATRGAMVLEVLRRADDPNAFAVGLKQLQTVVDVQDSTVQRVFELRDERAERADDAAKARSRAVQAANDAAATLEHLDTLREQAAALTVEVAEDERRQQELLGSLQTTEAETAQLVQRASARQQAISQELQEQRRREEEARRRAEEEAARTRAASSGGSAGGGGGGPPIDGVCPVVGAVAGRDFGNDWGYPRSGGRTHKGNDMFATKGTPVVAVAQGTVTSMNPPSSPTSLGGITVTYRTGDGSEWYNAHLDTIASGIAPGVAVTQGQTIGTVGQTGNARTTPPHLHVGRRYGGSWVNPWPTISALCR